MTAKGSPFGGHFLLLRVVFRRKKLCPQSFTGIASFFWRMTEEKFFSSDLQYSILYEAKACLRTILLLSCEKIIVLKSVIGTIIVGLA